MPLTLMERLFTQTGTWISITPPENPKDAETRTEHTLSRIRVSISSRSLKDSGDGTKRMSASATLFYRTGYSSVDGEGTVPDIHPGDVIISPMDEEWTVCGTALLYSPDGSLHHLEVELA